MLTVHNLSRHFGSHVAVDQFNLEIREGEFVTLLGPSGSGKSTVLRMIAGLLEPTSGTVHIAGRDVTRLPPQARGIGLVFQSYALFPHMTAAENIAFPLKVRRWSREQVRRRVDEMLELVGLAHRRDHLPEQLSGGERQRVALARSLAFRPPLLLLDEPLSALDAKVRVSLRESLKQIQATTGVTTLMVTHDQEEALELADRVAVMNQGRIEQVGTPAEIYYNPATAFTAQFIGSVTALRALVVSVREADDRSGPVATLEWAGCRFEWRVAGDAWRTGDVRTVYVRPESISVVPCAAEGFVPGRVVSRTFMGAMTRLSLDVGGERLIADVLSYQSAALVPGATAYVRVQDHRLADRQPSAGVSLGTGASLPADALAAGAASAVPVSTLSGHPAGSDPAGSGAGVAAGQAPAGSPGGPGVPGSGPVAADGAEVTG